MTESEAFEMDDRQQTEQRVARRSLTPGGSGVYLRSQALASIVRCDRAVEGSRECRKQGERPLGPPL